MLSGGGTAESQVIEGNAMHDILTAMKNGVKYESTIFVDQIKKASLVSSDLCCWESSTRKIS